MGHDSTTPYATPQSDVQTEKEKHLEVIPAGNWKRFFNFIVDYIAFIFLMGLTGFTIALLWREAGIQFIENTPDLVFGIPIFLGYYIASEYFTGKTLGKLITGTRVVNEYGAKATFKQVLYRSLCRLIPFEPLSFFGAKGTGWHDGIPNTYVIDTRKLNK